MSDRRRGGHRPASVSKYTRAHINSRRSILNYGRRLLPGTSPHVHGPIRRDLKGWVRRNARAKFHTHNNGTEKRAAKTCYGLPKLMGISQTCIRNNRCEHSRDTVCVVTRKYRPYKYRTHVLFPRGFFPRLHVYCFISRPYAPDLASQRRLVKKKRNAATKRR